MTPRKVIYFPAMYEHRKMPRVMFVTGEFEDEYRGASSLEELEDGRFDWFKKTRCQPYTDELFERVSELVRERDAITQALEKLRRR